MERPSPDRLPLALITMGWIGPITAHTVPNITREDSPGYAVTSGWPPFVFAASVPYASFYAVTSPRHSVWFTRIRAVGVRSGQRKRDRREQGECRRGRTCGKRCREAESREVPVAGVEHRVVCAPCAFDAVSIAGQTEPDENPVSRSPKNGKSAVERSPKPFGSEAAEPAVHPAGCVPRQRAQSALEIKGASQKQFGSFSRRPRTPSPAWRADVLATAAPSGEARHMHGAPHRLATLAPAPHEHQLNRKRHVSNDSVCQRRSADLEEVALEDEHLRAKLDEFGDVLDHDAAMLGENLDKWIGMMRRAVMADFLDSKTLILRRHGRLLADAREEYHASTDEVNQDLVQTSQRLQAAELTIGNRGITILRCADKLRNKVNATPRRQLSAFSQAMLMASRLFSRWRMAYARRQFEKFCRRLSGRHYRHSLLRKAMYTWKSDVGNTWRKLAERKLRAAAEKQIQSLAIEYEKKIAKLSGQLHQATTIIRESQTARANYEDTMKKAFLRGVCALNMEAMSVFNGNRRGVPSGLPENAPCSSTAAKRSTASREADSLKVDLGDLKPKTFADGPMEFTETDSSAGEEHRLLIASDAKTDSRREDRWDPHVLSCAQPQPQEVRKLYSHTPAARRPRSLGISSPSGVGRPRQTPANGAAIRPKSHCVTGREESQSEQARIVRQGASAVTVTRHMKPPDPGMFPLRAGVDPPAT
ncbi:MAG: hypothetical protein BJ554DRAFT_6185 [Olpidium bornovanus]|uniref:Centrosomal protein POC5 n=1 Tax=Olpidium bornovanus TaxID=278681 RepID=A0A8H7ZZ11_9FUNG|nr:MAG: hypothetical protein BJ554DRAFT_6185 [Olpidium bornovanus]